MIGKTLNIEIENDMVGLKESIHVEYAKSLLVYYIIAKGLGKNEIEEQ